MKKNFVYCYNKIKKEWEKTSLQNEFFNQEDVLKKERIQIVKDVLEFIKMYSGKDEKGKKIEYLPITLLPSKLLVVIGKGLSVQYLNDTKVKEIEKMSIFVDVSNKVALRYKYNAPKKQMERWGYMKEKVLPVRAK